MKTRLDVLLVKQNLAESLSEAQALIGAGQVYVDERVADKAGNTYVNEVNIRIKKRCPYVSRGGFKLLEALETFQVDVSRMICADIGASSGGFTDCLLQKGAAKVYAVDVAYGQFSWKLRQDSRVVVIERFNARKISPREVVELLDLAVIDASFISVTKLLPPLIPLFKKEIRIIALIKPQFELPKEMVGKGGVVTQTQAHQQAIDTISSFSSSHGMQTEGVVQSPLLGPKGNKEFLIYLKKKKID
ncbi:MAG: TlyA family RNA methyltransferase [Desulfopila sp.]|nr:TlyA family RNA methyltransferase [Desulfopila sp.]